MHVLLYSGQYALREEAVEEIKDCRSITQHWCRSTVTPEHWLSIFQDRLKPRSHTKYIHLSTRNNNEERISGFFKEGACWFMHDPVKEAGTEGTTSTSTDDTTSTSTDGTTSISIDSTISTSTNDTTSTSIDDSTHKSTDVSSCSPSLDVEKGITMEDSLELEEFLELEDGEKLEDLDSSREVTMEYFLELEEWLEDMDQNLKKKLDDDQHTSRAESPIPPDRSLQFSSHIEVLDDHQHIEASLRGLRFRDEVDKGPTEVASVDTDQIPSIDTDQIPSIDTNTSPLIDTTTASSIDSGRVSEQKDFNVCGNLRDEDTTTRSDKSGGKKRRNWKKRKRIKDGPQSFEVDFECYRFEVNQHPVAEVMHVLLKSGQYALREEAVEEIKDC
ncbi:hypothetical protein F2Q70_00004043 [Brassica cretica]|uniref:Uncharacterized protein n=1 Tax=Brassica cretica TaxID=69181 RepID=A0A8S9IZM6_BRACR|nr:hypothetical protein F2Q70_00004043 [Brassica cretica]